MYGHILQKVDASDAHASLSLAKVLHEKLGDFSRARDVFATAANANPTNYKILQAWAVMEARGEDTKEDPTKSPTEKTFKQKRALKKQESSAESLDAKLRSLAVARPLFQRASLVAPWSAHVWCAWANAEWRATRSTYCISQIQTLFADCPPLIAVHYTHHNHDCLPIHDTCTLKTDPFLLHSKTRTPRASCTRKVWRLTPRTFFVCDRLAKWSGWMDVKRRPGIT